MNKSVIIHILAECDLSCNLCYARAPKISNPIRDDEIGNLVKKGLLINPAQLSETISQIPEQYDIFLRGGEVSLYPNWDRLFLSFAENGHRLNIDTNGQWVPKNEAEMTEVFLETLKNLKHKNITIYFSCDKWHEEKDPSLKERTGIFIKYAEKYGVNFLIFAAGLKEDELKRYYQDLKIDFKKVRFNPDIYRLGRRSNDENAVDYCEHKEDEILVIDSSGDAYPCLKSFSEKDAVLKLGNIKEDTVQKLIEKSGRIDCDDCKNKKAWKSVIPADDLDAHMKAIGQAEANAKILRQMLVEFPIKPKTKILIPGCGTGQIFDYLDISAFEKAEIVFSDINEGYLNRLNQRLKKFQKIHYSITEDDAESSKIKDKFDSCIIVLVLEHLNWKKALENILNLRARSIYLIIQKQDKNEQVTSTYKTVPDSITKFSRIAKPHIIDESELKTYLKKKGFNLLKRYHEKVNNKEMVGMFFSK